MSDAQQDLQLLQLWMQQALLHPGGVVAGAAVADIERIVAPSASMTAAERLGVYAGMIQPRLHDALRDDFPAVERLLGHEAFHDLCRDFLVAHPSTVRTLNLLGRGMPAFLEEAAAARPNGSFLADLARLEWAIAEVSAEGDDPALSVDDLLPLQAAHGIDAVFQPIAALRLQTFHHPVNAWYRTWQRGEPGAIPAQGEPAENHVLVYRHGDRVWRVEAESAPFALLSALCEGLPLGASLERCMNATGVTEETLAAQIGGWFQTWASEGLFRAVHSN